MSYVHSCACEKGGEGDEEGVRGVRLWLCVTMNAYVHVYMIVCVRGRERERVSVRACMNMYV